MEQIPEIIRILSGELSIAANQILPHLAHYARVQAISNIAISFTAFLTSLIITIKYYAHCEKEKEKSLFAGDRDFIMTISLIITFAACVVFLGILSEQLPRVFAPEGAIILDILKRLK